MLTGLALDLVKMRIPDVAPVGPGMPAAHEFLVDPHALRQAIDPGDCPAVAVVLEHLGPDSPPEQHALQRAPGILRVRLAFLRRIDLRQPQLDVPARGTQDHAVAIHDPADKAGQHRGRPVGLHRTRDEQQCAAHRAQHGPPSTSCRAR